MQGCPLMVASLYDSLNIYSALQCSLMGIWSLKLLRCEPSFNSPPDKNVPPSNGLVVMSHDASNELREPKRDVWQKLLITQRLQRDVTPPTAVASSHRVTPITFQLHRPRRHTPPLPPPLQRPLVSIRERASVPCASGHIC